MTQSLGLALFFTLGVTLSDWHKAGFLTREVHYYQKLSEIVGPITFITYGGETDLELASSLSGIRILNNPGNLPSEQFVRQAPRMYLDELRKVGLIKSNQIKGAQAVLHTARLTGAKAIIRGGYLLSRFLSNRNLSQRTKFGLWRRELVLFHRADKVLLPTAEDVRVARQQYRLSADKVAVLPNFVDTKLFRPQPAISCVPGMVGFIGRIAPQKNLPTLIEAMAGLETARLRIIGDGPDRELITRLAAEYQLEVEITGRIPHESIPDLLAECEVFVLPSLYEGLPKALLEAMAAGLPVVATRVQGNESVIRHGETGWLCEDASVEALQEGLSRLLSNGHLRVQMGQNAREFVLDHFSLENVLAHEISIYQEMGLVE